MGLADDLRQAQQKAPQGCAIASVIASLDKPDAEALVAAIALDKRELAATVIVEILATHGHAVTPSTLGLHRRGKCACVARG